MATAGSIVVDLLMRTGSFETDSKRAERRLQDMGRSIDQWVRRTQFTTVAAAGAFTAWTMSVSKSMDATLKMSQQIGITTEALTGLRYAAQQFANVSDSTFDMALRRMTRRIDEAAGGSGAASKALKELGLSATDLTKLPVEEQFLRIADAMKATDNQSSRLRHTMAVFDTEGMPLVNALSQGRDELNRFVSEAERFGLVLSTEAAMAAERFQTQLSRSTAMVTGVSTVLAGQMMPLLADVAERMGDFATKTRNMSGAAQTLDGALRTLLIAGVSVAGVFDILAENIATAGTAAYLAATGDFKSAMAALEGGAKNSLEKFQGYIESIRWIWGEAGKGISELPPIRVTGDGDNNRPKNSGADPLAPFRARLAKAQELTAALREYGLAVDDLLPSERALLNLQGQMGLAVKDRVGKTSDATLRAQIALTQETAAQEKLAKQLRMTLEMRRDYTDSIDDQNAAVYTSVLRLQDQVRTWAMTDADTARNVDALAQARVRERIAAEESLLVRQLLDGASKEEIATTQKALAGLRTQLEYREQEAELNETIRRQQEDRAAFERTVSQWTDTVRAIDDVFRQGFADMVNAGEGTWKAFTKSMATTFKTTVADTLYKAFAQPFVVRIVAQMAGIMSGPGVASEVLKQSGITGGMPSLGWLTDFGGSITDTLNNFAWQNIGSEGVMGDISRALFDSSEAIGQFAEIGGDILGYGKAIFAAIDGEWGKAAGTAIGQFAGGPIGAMIGSMLGSMLDDAFRGETRYGAGYMVDPATGRAMRTGGPSGGDSGAAAAITAIEGVWSTTEALATRLGGTLAGLSFGAGSELSPEKGNSFVWSSWGRTPEEVSHITGMRALSGVTDGAVVAQEFAVELQRAVIRGLQMSDLDEHWRDWIDQFDVSALDEAGAQGVLSMIDALTRLRDLAVDMGMENLAEATAQAHANIIAMAGGIDAFAGSLQTYQQAFYTDAERQAATIEMIGRALAGVSLEMPALVGSADEMRAAYRALVDAQDLNTEAGQRAYATLIGAADAFNTVATAADAAAIAAANMAAAQIQAIQAEYDAIAQSEYAAAQAAYQAAVASANAAMQIVTNAINARKRELQDAYEAQADIIQTTIDASETALGRLQSLAGRLDSTLTSMLGSMDPLMSQQQAMLDIAAAAGTARRTGVLPELADLETALQRVTSMSADPYSSLLDYQRAVYGTAADIAYLGELTGDQVTLEQRALTTAQDQLKLLTTAYEDEVAYYDSMLDYQQSLYDAAMGNLLATMSVEDAIANLSSALSVLRATPQPVAPGMSQETPEGIVSGWYRDILGFEDPAGKAYWVEQLLAQGRADAFEDFVWVARQQGTLPQFDVGTNYVPYDMTARIHQGERIIPAAENRELMARLSQPAEGQASRAAMESMAREMAEMRQENKQLLIQVVKYGRQVAMYTEALDEWRQTGGVPVIEQAVEQPA